MQDSEIDLHPHAKTRPGHHSLVDFDGSKLSEPAGRAIPGTARTCQPRVLVRRWGT